MGFTRVQLEEIAVKLRAMPKLEPPPRDLTKQEAVKVLAKEIKSLRAKGYSMEQIANSLKGFGLDVSTPTLKNYLQKSKPKSKALAPTSNTPLSESSDNSPTKKSEPVKATDSKAKFTPRKDRTDI